jgi:hypothetical protein
LSLYEEMRIIFGYLYYIALARSYRPIALAVGLSLCCITKMEYFLQRGRIRIALSNYSILSGGLDQINDLLSFCKFNPKECTQELYRLLP